MLSTGTPSADSTDTKVCRISRGTQSSPSPGLPGDHPERADHVVRRQGRTDPGGEDQAVLLPELTSPQPLLLPLLHVLSQRFHAAAWQRQGPPRLVGLGIAAMPLGAPDIDRVPVLTRSGGIEPGGSDTVLGVISPLTCAPTATRTRDLLLRRTWATTLGPVRTQVSGHAEVSASDCH